MTLLCLRPHQQQTRKVSWFVGKLLSLLLVVDVIAVVNAAIVVVDFLTGSRANRAGHKNRRKAQCDGDPDNDPQDAAQQCIQEGNKRRQLGCENIYIENIHLQ